jgi:hypothetical protein
VGTKIMKDKVKYEKQKGMGTAADGGQRKP